MYNPAQINTQQNEVFMGFGAAILLTGFAYYGLIGILGAATTIGAATATGGL